jgi:hypothetical protein
LLKIRIERVRKMIGNKLAAIDIECLERRTAKVIGKFGLSDLMEYTVGSLGGSDLDDFYRTVVEEVLLEETYVKAWETSDGKYEVSFEFEGKDICWICSYAWDTIEIVVENLIDNVIIPHMKRRKISCQNQSIA